MKALSKVLLLFLLTAKSTFSAPAGDRLSEVVHRWNRALAERNLNALLEMSAPGAMIILADGKVVRDRKEILRFWQDLIQQQRCPSLDLKEVIYQGGDTIVSKIIWKEGGGTPLSGEAYGVFRRDAQGKWVLQLLRWN